MNHEPYISGLVRYDPEFGVVVDEGGLLYPASAIDALEACIGQHKKLSALELEAIARKLVEKRFPHMMNQINWDRFR